MTPSPSTMPRSRRSARSASPPSRSSPTRFTAARVAAFRDKLGVRTYAPSESLAAIRKRVEVDGTLEDLPKDAAIEVRRIDGIKTGEPWLLVRSDDNSRTSSLSADSVFNLRHGGLLLKLIGSSGPDLKVATPIFKLFVMRDRPRPPRILRASRQRGPPDAHRSVPRRDRPERRQRRPRTRHPALPQLATCSASNLPMTCRWPADHLPMDLPFFGADRGCLVGLKGTCAV